MNRALLALIFSLVSFGAVAGPIIQIDGNLYKIDTYTGLLSTNRSTIESQVWFGDSSLARTFANALGVQSGLPNFGQLGPAFGYEIYDGVGADYTTSWFYKPTNAHLDPDNRAQVQNAAAGVYFTYAVAEQIGVVNIPEPKSYIMLLTGLILLSMVRARETISRK